MNWIRFLIVVLLCAGIALITIAQDITEYVVASNKFEQLVLQSPQNHRMPQLNDKDVVGLISTLSNHKCFLDSINYQLKDLDTLMDICGRANKAVMSYVLFDLNNNVDFKRDQNQIAFQTIKLMENNIITYQDELEQLHPFHIRCHAKLIPLMNEFILSLKPEDFTEIRRGGLNKVRNGIFGGYYGILQHLNNSALKESYRRKTLQSMAENARIYASVLQPPMRMQIYDLAKLVQSSIPTKFNPYLQKIMEEMNTNRCDGLCKF